MNQRIQQMIKVAIIAVSTSAMYYSGPLFIAAVLGHGFFSGSRLAPLLAATYGLLASWYVAKKLLEKSADIPIKQKLGIAAITLVVAVVVLGRFFFAQLAWIGLSLVGGPLTFRSVLMAVTSSLFLLIAVWTAVYHAIAVWRATKSSVFRNADSLLDPIVICLTLSLVILSWLSIFMEPVFDLLKRISW